MPDDSYPVNPGDLAPGPLTVASSTGPIFVAGSAAFDTGLGRVHAAVASLAEPAGGKTVTASPCPERPGYILVSIWRNSGPDGVPVLSDTRRAVNWIATGEA